MSSMLLEDVLNYSANSEFLCSKSFEKWGKENQFRQLQEECAELIAVINHFLKKEDEKNTKDFLEEFVDVCIMVDKFRTYITNSKNNEQFQQIFNEKVRTLREYLEGISNKRGW